MDETDVEIIMQEWNSLELPDTSFISVGEYMGYVCVEREDMLMWLLDIVKCVRRIEREARNG